MKAPIPLFHPPSDESFLFAAADDLPLHAQWWHPKDASRATLALVHGYAEHSGRYGHVAGYLAARGFSVAAYDHRGHGRSGGPRAYVDDFDHYVDDLQRFLQEVHQRNGDSPVFLLGHSMGGVAAAHYALRDEASPSNPLAGLILSSPAVRLGETISPLLQRASALIGQLFPKLPTLRQNRKWLSRDVAAVSRTKADPLSYHGRTRARLGAELIRAGREVLEQGTKLTLPLLVLHGSADRIASIRGSYSLYHRAASRDKTLQVYEGLYHEVFNEVERAHVLDDVYRWLDEHL